VLVLTRRIDESIVINGEIVITVLEVGRNGQVLKETRSTILLIHAQR